jgi:hypothetical protein
MGRSAILSFNLIIYFNKDQDIEEQDVDRRKGSRRKKLIDADPPDFFIHRKNYSCTHLPELFLDI